MEGGNRINIHVHVCKHNLYKALYGLNGLLYIPNQVDTFFSHGEPG